MLIFLRAMIDTHKPAVNQLIVNYRNAVPQNDVQHIQKKERTCTKQIMCYDGCNNFP